MKSLEKILFYLLVFFAPFTTLSGLELKERLLDADKGAYMLLQQKQNYTLFHIVDSLPKALIIEEISIPKKEFLALKMSVQEWLDKGAQENTSWLIYALSKESARVLSAYSYTQHAWLNTSSLNQFLPTLLHIPFKKVPDNKRKRVSGTGSKRTAPFWTPKVFFEGELISHVPFNEWEGFWPEDQSELSSVRIEMFLPSDQASVPDYFPYWMAFKEQAFYQIVRVINSGLNLLSPIQSMPLQAPLFTSPIKETPDSYVIDVTLDFQELSYLLQAKDLQGPSSWMTLPFKLEKKDNNQLLVLNKKELRNFFKKGKTYLLVFSIKDHSTLHTSTSLSYSP